MFFEKLQSIAEYVCILYIYIYHSTNSMKNIIPTPSQNRKVMLWKRNLTIFHTCPYPNQTKIHPLVASFSIGDLVLKPTRFWATPMTCWKPPNRFNNFGIAKNYSWDLTWFTFFGFTIFKKTHVNHIFNHVNIILFM